MLPYFLAQSAALDSFSFSLALILARTIDRTPWSTGSPSRILTASTRDRGKLIRANEIWNLICAPARIKGYTRLVLASSTISKARTMEQTNHSLDDLAARVFLYVR